VKRSLSSRLWERLGIATTRAVSADGARLTKRLDRADKRADRVHDLLTQHQEQTAAVAAQASELRAAVAKLQQEVADATARAELLAVARKNDLRALRGPSELAAALDVRSAAIEAHVTRALARSTLSVDPFPHMVIDDLLPDDFYRSLLDELPPAEYWRSSGKSREYWEIDSDAGPWRTEVVWRFVDHGIVDRMLRPRFIDAFGPHLAQYWREGFDLDPAAVRYVTAEGRLQLRRKGYQLRPHLDPPHGALTGLFYLARPGDDPKYGTALYRPSTPLPINRQGIYYPEDHGITLEPVTTVPFRANTLLVWMTPLGTHGADLIGGDVPKHFERYSYQFQVVVDEETRRRIKTR
jgi:hypothetical protein